jgi:hypothetical protein
MEKTIAAEKPDCKLVAASLGFGYPKSAPPLAGQLFVISYLFFVWSRQFDPG